MLSLHQPLTYRLLSGLSLYFLVSLGVSVFGSAFVFFAAGFFSPACQYISDTQHGQLLAVSHCSSIIFSSLLFEYGDFVPAFVL